MFPPGFSSLDPLWHVFCGEVEMQAMLEVRLGPLWMKRIATKRQSQAQAAQGISTHIPCVHKGMHVY